MHNFEYQIANSIFVIRYSNCRIYLWKPIELVIFQGEGGPDPLPSFGSSHAFSLKLSSHTYVFFTQCLTTLHGYIKSACDQSRDIWRLKLGKIKNTTFLVKRKFLFLRTILDVLMKLMYALLRKQRTHNLRYIVRALLMKLAPGHSINSYVLTGL